MTQKKNKKRPITIDDLWAMKRFGAPSLSPDGRWACAAVTSFSMASNEGTTQLWLFGTDGAAERQLTHGRKDADPQWSPDGRWIAFTSKRARRDGDALDEEAQLYVIPAAGGEAMRVTDHATGVSALRWFPDSSRIAFVSWVWPGERGIKAQARRMKAERDDKVTAYALEHNHYRYWDHWLSRGRSAHIHTATLSTAALEAGLATVAKVRDLFDGTDFRLPPQEPDAGLFDISPDGDQIAFTHDFEPDPRAPSFTDIVVMDVAKGKWTCPTRTTGRAEEAPRFSPDGRWIAMISSDLARAHNEQGRLALIDRRDGRVVPLTFDWDRGIGAPPVWTADSTALLFVAEDAIAQPIWTLALPADAGSSPPTPRELLRGPRHGGVATDLALSRDGRTIVYSRSSQAHPPTLLASDANGGGERRIEALNVAILDRLEVAASHSVTIAGFDGEPVQMWVCVPAGFDFDPAPPAKRPGKRRGTEDEPGKRWPLMHTIHGGPHTCWNDAWHWRWNMQLFAAQGQVVASVNYHGSTGWGQAFLGSIDGDWGRRELADVEAGTEFLLATGRIDPARITATGGSYGGYMVALMNGRAVRDRYAAYVCHAGCYDWVGMMGSDGYFWFGQELGAFPWEDEARVLKQSPHHYAADFATPTLVMHGELDYRVPYYQGLAYYNTLRVLGVPSRLVCYPDENHWILKPQNSRLWYREFFEWIERHAGPAKVRRKIARKSRAAASR